MTTALVIPVEGPLEEVELKGNGDDLELLQDLVGGLIQALPLPNFISGNGNATAYVNEEGKFDSERFPFNGRATDFMVPGVGLQWGDWIAGPFVLCGFVPYTGRHSTLPAGVVARARLIENEAG